jgi:hypothetical protein
VKESLQTSEWIFFITICALVATVFTISKFTSYRSLDLLDQRRRREEVQIKIEIGGHVKCPGSYQIVKGQPLSEVLFKAKPKPLADLSVLDLSKSLDEPCSIHIKALEKVAVQVAGCVKEIIFLELPAGSRICDLKGHIELSSEADRGFLRRRRILKDREVIVVLTSCK